MDDLLKLAGELVKDNNFQKDDFQEEQKPDGEYAVVIKSIKLKESAEKGSEWFSFVLDVTDGDYAGETFYVNLFLTEKTVKGTLSKIMRLVTSLGYELDVAMFNDKDAILEGLTGLVGNETTLTKETSKNGYINYSFKGGK